jgi:phytoene synthase
MSLKGLAENDISDVTAIVRESATSFYRGMNILEADRRAAMFGIYAFCRKVDDIADDDDVPLPEKRERLEAWRQRVSALFAGTADDAITRVLRASAAEYHLREADLIGIIDGMEMDAGEPMVAPPMQILDLYCDRVASTVGRLSVCVFGDNGAAAQRVAYFLGRALQLTNILRDVREDAQRGRLRLCSRRAMRPAKLMAASYRPLLGILRASNFTYSEQRVSLPKYRKLLLAVRLYLP